MTDPRRPRSDDPERLRSLLRAAGPRPPVPEDRARRARVAAREAWRETVASRRRRRFPARLAAVAAAVALVALGAWTWSRRDVPAGAPVATPEAATVVRVVGGVDVRGASGGTKSATAGLAVEAPSTWTTSASGRVAVRLASGHEIRLDRDTRVEAALDGAWRLERGALYVDSRGARPGSGPRIRTAHGTVIETGTQYEVRVASEPRLRIRVRDGAVRLDRDGTVVDVAAGRERAVASDGSSVERSIAPDDPSWNWVGSVAEPFVLDGRTLADFLTWAERERGARFRFEDPASAAGIGAITLQGGSLEGYETEDALTVVLTACGWSWRRDESSGVYVLRK